MCYDWMDWESSVRDYWTLKKAFYHDCVQTCTILSYPRHWAPWFFCHWHEFHKPQEPPGDTFHMVCADAVSDPAEDFLQLTDETNEFFRYVQFWDLKTPYTRPQAEVEAMRDRRARANARHTRATSRLTSGSTIAVASPLKP